ncbi:hypothetical protein AUEXF2481DRAFT_33208 [Aureobasidium subglaciale EXF-2481]|uniref:RING-type E3 ubiquitin transferase n=1 Tax=Aureobasidium subglaciale (strain EXF-2481) TaxID=1043005 RepID=A0A074YWL2_AURSE|nr:uncharacterized protein AUEXF2481DRAFT_33208 [Aureobasidium subglaciale EXF-2481]KEQ91256.1 hypothetical protein AUEXF2481DRAFT_33208 [Aureobasidium subglaciale EXF-2481]
MTLMPLSVNPPHPSSRLLPHRMEVSQHDYDPSLGFRIKGKAKLRDAPQDTCVICLDTVTERAVAVPCNHLNFDFLCLCSWTQEHPSCPLCKTPLTAIEYDWRSPDDRKVYIIPKKEEPKTPSVATGTSRFRPPRRTLAQSHHTTNRNPDAALAFRRRIYADQNYSLHVGTNRTSQYRNFTPATFTTSAALQSRARLFMRREFQAFDFLAENNARLGFLIEYIVAVLKTTEIKDASGSASTLAAEFLGTNAASLFLHELEAWLRSPYERLEDWDRHVQYAPKRPRYMNG